MTRPFSFLGACAAFAVAIGCGGSSSSTTTTTDGSVSGKLDGSTFSTLDQSATLVDFSGTDGPPIACNGPSECGGDPCCLSIAGFSFGGLTCATSASACVPAISITTGSGETRVCTTDADCTSGLSSSMFPTCCTGSQNGQSIKLCFSSSYASLSQGAVTCP